MLDAIECTVALNDLGNGVTIPNIVGEPIDRDPIVETPDSGHRREQINATT